MPPWIQPVATVVGPVTASLIVLYGVVKTLKQNALRLRAEQLEKRAKDKEVRLQELYGDFAAIGLEYQSTLLCYNRLKDLSLALEVVTPKHILEGLAVGEDRSKVKSTIDNVTQEKLNAWNFKVLDHDMRLKAAYTRLTLSDDDEWRLKALSLMHKRLQVTELKPESRFFAFCDFDEFTKAIGQSLAAEYEVSRRLAENGSVPTRTIRAWPKETKDS